MPKQPFIFNWQKAKYKATPRSASTYSIYKFFIKVNLVDFNVDFYKVQKPLPQSFHPKDR